MKTGRTLSPEAALRIVLDSAPLLPAEPVALPDAAGRVLREAIRSDRDVPEFDKAMMDGYAVIAADLSAPPRDLEVIAEIPAGADPGRLVPVTPGRAARIMTGAPLPPGADAVLVVEETEPIAGAADRIRAKATLRAGDNFARKGEDVRAGDTLLEAGDFIGAGEIGVLAACGRTRVLAGRRPRIAVLPTGDELVDPGATPGPGRIRNSNGPLLLALAARAGALPTDLGIVRDDRRALAAALARGLEHDVLVLSGGVSMGVYDLVGESLAAAGVAILFDRVAIKPGRPFTFGRRGATIVFGCPGNPVSSYVIFTMFARPALRKMMGHPAPVPAPLRGVLDTPVRQRPGRAGCHQARVRFVDGVCRVEVLPTTGSADFVSCARGNALALVPADVTALAAGDPIDVLLIDDHDAR
jgi:molybdopterin molybdotransferase